MAFFEKHGVEGKELFQVNLMKNHNFPLHFHRAYEIICVKSGELYVSIDQKEYLLKENDLIFIFSNQIHEFKNADHFETLVILFSPELIGDFYRSYKGFIPNDNALHLKRGIDLGKLKSIYGQKSFLYDVCAELISQKSFTAVKQSPQTKVLYKMLLYVEEKYTEDCTLKDAAKYIQYDYPYISKLFAQQMNMTFTEYLNQYRISQACYLLKNSEQSISEVANNCGYNNLRSFHRNFREIINCAPKEYRAKNMLNYFQNT